MDRARVHGIIVLLRRFPRDRAPWPWSDVLGTTPRPGDSHGHAAADRHLLFGLLALQNGIISQVQLVAAFQAWTLDKTRSLADHLEARGDLTAARRALLEGLAEVHLEAHGGEVENSLAAVSATGSTRARLAESATRRSTPRSTGSAPATTVRPPIPTTDRTASFAVGTATSDGQRFRVLRPHAQGGLGAVFVALDARAEPRGGAQADPRPSRRRPGEPHSGS